VKRCAALVQTSGNSAKWAKAIAVNIGKSAAGGVRAIARVCVKLVFIKGSAARLGKAIVAATGKSAGDKKDEGASGAFTRMASGVQT
jgi:hypothetical protein